jgi:serine/threonine-protein kinase RsbW
VTETAGKNIVLAATLNNFEYFMSFIDEFLTELHIDDNERTRILTASEEIIVNIINHAYHDYSGALEIILVYQQKTIKITFIDSGIRFNPLDRPDVNVKAPLAERETGGLGILMVKNLMNEVLYEYKDSKNHFTIIKYLSGTTTKTE